MTGATAAEAMAPQPLLQCGVWARACAGQQHSGDLHLIAAYHRGMLAAVVDGCGHGPEAAAAARAAIAALREHPELDVVELMHRCHQQLRETRGAVVGLASFQGRENLLTWLGVGNIEARLWHTANPPVKTLLMRAGVAGYTLPALQAMATTVEPGDLLIVATDGIHASFADELDISGDPREIAARIGEQSAKGSDDGLVLVARYLGWPR